MAKITIMGDLLCYQGMTEKYGKDYGVFYKEVGKLKDCDYLIANPETPFAGEDMRYTFERYCFNTPVTFIRALKDLGVNLLTLANNHCMDRKEEGVLRTLENCKKEGFETIGLYASQEERNALFIKEFDGIRVAFINYTYGTNAFAHHNMLEKPYTVNLLQPEELTEGSIHLLDSSARISERVQEIYYQKNKEYDIAKKYLERLEKDIKKAKENADYLVAIIHCGGQYNDLPDAYTKYVYERIKEYGADIIVGNHPHIIQSCDNTDGYLTVYSMGNFIDSPEVVGEQGIDYRYNAVMHLTIEKQNGKVVAKKEFSLYKVIEEDGLLYAIDTFDLYNRTKSEKDREEILHFANRFAGENKYQEVSERYQL